MQGTKPCLHSVLSRSSFQDPSCSWTRKGQEHHVHGVHKHVAEAIISQDLGLSKRQRSDVDAEAFGI